MQHLVKRCVIGLIATLLLAMVLLNVVNVIARRGFGQAIPAADELMTFTMVWLVFLGCVLVAADDRHLRFDMATNLLPERGRALLSVVLDLAIALLAGFVAIQSYTFVSKLAAIDQRSMAAGLPMVIPHMAVLVGLAATAALAAARALARASRMVGNRAQRS